MLALWKLWGVDEVLKEAWRNEIIISGFSAGAICWFEQALTDSIDPGILMPLNCLGFLPGSSCPHYDTEKGRRPMYHRLIGDGVLSAGFALDDGVGLHFVDQRLKRAIRSRSGANAYWVDGSSGQISETVLKPMVLKSCTDVVSVKFTDSLSENGPTTTNRGAIRLSNS
jgi:peptidase E